MCQQRLPNGLSAGRFENGDVTEDRLKSVFPVLLFYLNTLKELKMKLKQTLEILNGNLEKFISTC